VTNTLRFGVRGPAGLSPTYRVWLNPGGRDDSVYVLCRATGVAFKSSLHERGDWHLKIARPEQPHQPLSEHRWPQPSPLAPGVTRAFAMVVPRTSLGPARGSDSVVWWDIPKDAKGAEFDLFFVDERMSGHPALTTALT